MAQMDTKRSRSGSLSSGSDSDSDSGDGDNRPGRIKSAIVQVAPGHSKPSPLWTLPTDVDRNSSPSSQKKRCDVISPSSPHLHRQRYRSSSRDRTSPSLKQRRASPPDSYNDRDRNTPPYKRTRQSQTRSLQSSSESEDTPSPKRKRKEPDPLTTRTGGAYIPPARLRMMQAGITDKSSVAYQRVSWEALKKSINGLINKVNVSNIDKIVPELFEENVVRGRGLLSRSTIQAQAASPMFSHVYAGLVSVINTKFPQTGEIICKRLILQFRRGFKRNDKNICMTAVKFLAHLVNQQVLHELVALELLTLLMEEPSDDTVEVAVGFIKECGLKLSEVSPRGIHAMFETLRSILHSGKISSRIQYMIEVLFAIRKDKFKDYPAVTEGLDLVEEDDQITHLLSLTDDINGEEELNVFHQDPDFVANEEKYKVVKTEILGGGSGSEESGSGSSDGEESSESEEEDETKMEISDMTEASVLALRRTIYLTIMSSANYEECVHKLLKRKQEGSESEITNMIIECCSQERSYLRFYGLLAQRLCLLNQAWVAVFDEAFQQQYATVHRLETNKLRNTARLFAQLFYSDALPWTVLSCVHLNEEETNSSSRIFVKILIQELSEFMGIVMLNERLRDPLLAVAFEGLLPRDNPKNTRFAINFFTSIGLGGLTDDLREHLKNAQKMIMEQKQDVSSSDTDSSSSEEEESSSEESSSEDNSETSSSEDDKRHSRHSHRKKYSHEHWSKGEKHPSVSDSKHEGKKRYVERSQRKRRSDSPERSQRKRRDSPERPQRKRESDSPERSQKKRRGDSPERPQRKRRGDSHERSQSKRGGDSHKRLQRKKRGDSPDRPQRKRGGDSPERSRRKRRGDSPERPQRKRGSDSPKRSHRNRGIGEHKQ